MLGITVGWKGKFPEFIFLFIFSEVKVT